MINQDELEQIKALLPDNLFDSKDYNSEGVVGRVQWLLEMHKALEEREELAWEMLSNVH